MSTPAEELRALVRAGWRLLALETFEEERAVSLLERVGEALERPCIQWSVASGLGDTGHGHGSLDEGLQAIAKHPEPAIFALLDAHRMLEDPIASGQLLMVMSIGSVLSGAIFGDHCSPISDTTVMSSIACASDHIDHVRTQVPYALATMAASLAFGYFPAAYYGLSPWVGILAGMGLLAVVLITFGKRSDEPASGT